MLFVEHYSYNSKHATLSISIFQIELENYSFSNGDNVWNNSPFMVQLLKAQHESWEEKKSITS